MNIPQILEKQAARFPDKPAFIFQNTRVSFRQLRDYAFKLADSLHKLGVGKGDKVAILHPNCHYFLEAYYGIAQIGAVSVPINYRLLPREIAFILQDSESKILIADPVFEKTVDPVRAEVQEIEKIIWTGKGG